jgi:hypothetical protein
MLGSRVRVPPLLLASQSLYCGWLMSFRGSVPKNEHDVLPVTLEEFSRFPRWNYRNPAWNRSGTGVSRDR